MTKEERYEYIQEATISTCLGYSDEEWCEISDDFNLDALESIIYFCNKNNIFSPPCSDWNRLLEHMNYAWLHIRYPQTIDGFYCEKSMMPELTMLGLKAKNRKCKDKYGAPEPIPEPTSRIIHVNAAASTSKEIESLNSKIKHLENALEGKNESIRILNDEYYKLKDSCAKLLSENEKLEVQVEDLKGKYREQESERDYQDEWYRKEYYCRFFADALRFAVKKKNEKQREAFRMTLSSLASSIDYLPIQMRQDIEALTEPNSVLSNFTFNYGKKSIHQMCDSDAIIKYVEKLTDIVAEDWKSKWKKLWEAIVSNDTLAAELANKGRQQKTTFNRTLVCNIIAYLHTEGIVIYNSYYDAVAILENGNKDHTIKNSFNKIHDATIRNELDAVIESIK